VVRALELVAAAERRTNRARETVAACGTRPLTALCLHGLGVSPRYLDPLVRVLRRERGVVAPQLPQGAAVERWAELALDHVTEPVTVFANSLGCQAAVEVAIRRPELVRSLVLVGPTWDPSAPLLRQQFARLVLDSVRETPRLNWVVASDYVRNGPLQTLRGARGMLRHPMAERLPLVSAPAVVVRGERDPIVSRAWAAQVAALLHDATQCEIRGAAHCAHFTHPEEVVASERRRR
jgi:pimeloyl-ACP methyl ester carboxylesterase